MTSLDHAQDVEAFFTTLPEPKRLVVIRGVDHFFTGKLDEVGAAIGAWVEELSPRKDTLQR